MAQDHNKTSDKHPATDSADGRRSESSARSRKRRKKKKDPFFARRMWTIAAVVLATLVVGLVVFFENVREAKQANDPSESNMPVALDTVEALIKNGSVEDMLEFSEANAINQGQAFVLVYEQFQERIKLFQEMERRSGNLDEQKQQEIKQELIELLVDFHATCHHEQLLDEESEANALAILNRMINEPDKKTVKLAGMGLCSIHLMNALVDNPQPAKIDTAHNSVSEILQRYPEDNQIVDVFYSLLLNMGYKEHHATTVNNFHNQLIQHCSKSNIESIRSSGDGFRGRQLLLQHGIIDHKGMARMVTDEDLAVLNNRFDDYLAEDFVMTPQVVSAVLGIVNSLEKAEHLDQAKHISETIMSRIGDTELFAVQRKQFREVINRLSLLNQIIDFPHHKKTDYAVVLYLKNNEVSLAALSWIRKLQQISPTRKFEVILVTDEVETGILRHHTASDWKDFSLIQDPKRESAYFQVYPVNRYPTMLVLDETGKAINVGATIPYLEKLNRELKKGT